MTTLEGGVRVPFCVQWKGKIPAGRTTTIRSSNSTSCRRRSLAAGGTVDPAWKLDGVDMLPYLTGKDADRAARDPRTGGSATSGRSAKATGSSCVNRIDGVKQPAALYNLKDDIGEAKDLVETQPEKAKELKADWDKWDASNVPARWQPNEAKKKKKAKDEDDD